MKIVHYIGGQFQSPKSDQWLEDVNPATGEVIASVANGDAQDVDLAVAAATAAWPAWSALASVDRADFLIRLAALIDRDADSLARCETDDNGKPLWMSRTMDMPRAATNFRFFAAAMQGWASQSHAMPNGLNYTLRQPLGVVGCISPWNLPLYLLTWKIAPALAAGNCVIAKPSELTPWTAFRLCELCQEVGLPPGVLNVVHGHGPRAGEAMVRHPAVRAISFTGGTATGQHLASVAAPMFKRLSLELGGKNPNIVFADCDYENMMTTTLRSSFANQGQICLCGSRILVERNLYARFRDDFVARAAALQVGDPLDSETQLGAVISPAHQVKILRCIDRARTEGANILTGGQAVKLDGRCAHGSFVAPTVIDGLGPNCRTNQEEIFGPVVTLQPFDTDEEAVALANATDDGLSASLWTSRIDRAHRVAAQIAVGVVWINCWLVRDLRTPFGGVRQSGVGREGGEDALRFFTEAKNVCLQI